jgi:hypothetical protein
MEFRNWILREGMRELARAYSDGLRNVPQNLDHHPEGSVLNHVKLVRKSVLAAAQELQNLKHEPLLGDALSNLDFNLGEEEIKILNLAAWLHDIGKSTATTVDGIHYSKAPNMDGKVQAIGHESPEHYGPQVEKMLSLAPKSLVDFYDKHRDVINFLIERHMDFAHGGFGKKVLSSYFVNGRIKNDPYIKLLLVLMWADKMGRGKIPELADNINKLRMASEKSRASHAKMDKSSKPFAGSEDEFRSMLRSRGLDQSAIDAAVKSKFSKVQD